MHDQLNFTPQAFKFQLLACCLYDIEQFSPNIQAYCLADFSLSEFIRPSSSNKCSEKIQSLVTS